MSTHAIIINISAGKNIRSVIQLPSVQRAPIPENAARGTTMSDWRVAIVQAKPN